MLAVLDAGHDLPLGCGVAAQLVGDQNTRRSPLLLQQLAQKAFGSLLVAPALDENVENKGCGAWICGILSKFKGLRQMALLKSKAFSTT
jgi:hypothetical protein